MKENRVHVVVSIPPKVSVSDYMGMIKVKTAIRLFKGALGERKKPYWENYSGAHGYFVSIIGVDEEMIRKYVRYQEKQERHQDKDQRSIRLS